jgi:small subunit ribosomal protein S20
MANLKSSKRDIERSRRKNEKNRSVRSKVRNLRKKAIELIESGNEAASLESARLFESSIFKAVSKGVFKKQTAIRYLSRLVQKRKKKFNLYQA